MTKKLWSYLVPFRGLIFFSVLLMIVSKGIEAYVPIAIGNVTNHILGGGSFELKGIISMSLSIIGLLLIAYVFDNIIIILKNWIGQKALYRLRQDIYRHMLRLPVSYFNEQRVGTLMTRTIHDVDQITQMFSEGVVPLIGSLMLFVCIAVFLTFLEWRLALLLGLILPFVYWLTDWFRINQRRCYGMIRHTLGKMNAFVQEHLLGASTIRSFGLQKEEQKQFDIINEEYRQITYETIRYFALFFAGIDFVQSFALVAVFAVIVLFIPGDADEFQPGLFFAFSLYVLMLFRPLADLADRYNMLQAAFAAFERIFDVLNQVPEKEVEGPKIEEIESLEFQDVWFAYKNEEWVLKGVSFRLNKGESAALVGMTGSGKTTLLNLLLRFYDYQKGKILLNGLEITAYPLKEVRALFAVVLQDPEIFSGTIEENVSLYNSAISEEDVLQACAYVSLDHVLQKFPGGIRHVLTERGKGLSAGERQLISLARAVAHDRSCLILDEATANIDTASERKIQGALSKILHHKTALVIAHRLSTIKGAHKILVLHNGRVLESGTHAALIQLKGVYEKLYRLQFVDGIA